ncbi:hypothetical protein cand_035000 [Cryptosporidium andersoni]|uniref:Uncharacterized protein n=1 Tax=Cryptosporidium andersoni TaxID=117008 RepID=A0A1J4MXM0_9CRYT|nr:hypothetical protein cand_035000 [Cryptosporidium andersoni]
MEVRAIQIYKPINKNEVRLVYRIKHSPVLSENGRHQKSYSFNKYGETNAWNFAREVFQYINKHRKLPLNFSDPCKSKFTKRKRNEESIPTPSKYDTTNFKKINMQLEHHYEIKKEPKIKEIKEDIEINGDKSNESDHLNISTKGEDVIHCLYFLAKAAVEVIDKEEINKKLS